MIFPDLMENNDSDFKNFYLLPESDLLFAQEAFLILAGYYVFTTITCAIYLICLIYEPQIIELIEEVYIKIERAFNWLNQPANAFWLRISILLLIVTV